MTFKELVTGSKITVFGGDADKDIAPNTKLYLELCNYQYKPAKLPNKKPDFDLTIDPNSNTEYRRRQFNMPISFPNYPCHYYSEEGVIDNDIFGECVYAPESFRKWVNSHKLPSPIDPSIYYSK